jgi:hypothetical protein
MLDAHDAMHTYLYHPMRSHDDRRPTTDDRRPTTDAATDANANALAPKANVPAQKYLTFRMGDPTTNHDQEDRA